MKLSTVKITKNFYLDEHNSYYNSNPNPDSNISNSK